MLKTLLPRALICASLVVMVFAAANVLPQEASKRTELRRSDLAGTQDTEVIMAELELPPGASVPRHYHHGEEFLYVIDGGSVVTPDNKTIEFKPGMTLHFPREEVHGGFTATGSSVLKVVTVHIVDKGKPLYVPVE